MKSLNEIVAELRIGDDGGKPAYRIGRADKVEVSMPSGTPVRSYVIECVTIKELADWIEAAVARERGAGNAAALREALEALVRVIDECDSGSPLWWHHGAKGVVPLQKARSALTVPPRQCDVGTVEEQEQRYKAISEVYFKEGSVLNESCDKTIAHCFCDLDEMEENKPCTSDACRYYVRKKEGGAS